MTLLNADRWIKSVLGNDSAVAAIVGTRIYAEVAPEDTAYPLITISFVDLTPVGNASADKVMDTELWRVRVIHNEPTYKNLETLADRIRTLLHKTSGTGVIGCVFAGARRLPEFEDGKLYRSIILEFEIFTQ